MKKQMNLWQLLTGYVLCVAIILSVFLPKMVLHPSQMMDDLVDVLVEDGGKIVTNYLKFYNELSGQEVDISDDSLQEGKDELAKALKMKGTFFHKSECSISSYSILFMTKSSLKKELDAAFTDFNDAYNGKLPVIVDTDTVSDTLYQTIAPELWRVRVLLAIQYGLPFILMVLYLVAYLRKWSIKVPAISSGIYLVCGSVIQLLLQIRVPKELVNLYHTNVTGKVTSWIDTMKNNITDNLSDNVLFGDMLQTSIDSLINEYIKEPIQNSLGNFGTVFENALKKSITGTAFIWWGLVAAVLVWIVLILFSGKKRSDYDAKIAQMSGSATVNRVGTIRVLGGSLKGAELSLQPGEQITLGRNPALSHLIIQNAKVSGQHCRIYLDSSADFYRVECYSDNGVQTSSQQWLQKNHSVTLPRGSWISVADGEEVIGLE